ncbi:hypothetical protein Dda_6998 [Drechslerella dactyloides]|uniref:Uncharacterized protein n=1 Tax=Drechslerella dactyloides TaxID=74499 RepID=A0AAD6NH54_DREDA|nr:hypothetical protein Dda_6998 [Drechslerella dactyloides]
MNKCVREHQLLEKMWDKIMDGFVSIKKHLPESQHHFLDLLYATYHMFTMLYERFPEYSIFWSLKLGDIAWVRSKLEVDEGIWDSCVQSECWVEISYSWYHQATTLQPDIGALHWNLMPLIKYDALSALFLLYKTLTARKACLAAHTDEGINKSIDLLMKLASSCPPEIKFFINSHISDFLRKDQDLAPIKQMEYLQIHKPILMTRAKSDLQTIQIAVCGISSLTLEASKCKLEAASTAKEKHKVTKMSEVSTEDISGHLKPRLVHNIAFQLLSFALENPQNERIHRHIHIWLIFLDFIQTHPAQMAWVVKAFPWSHLTQYATWLLRRRRDQNQLLPPQHDIEGFPFALGYCPLPEEILVRGLNITGTFFPENYFANCSTVPNTIYRESPYPGVIETTGMGIIRQEKILWLLMRLAKSRTWIVYNPTCSQFTISPKLGTFLRRD